MEEKKDPFNTERWASVVSALEEYITTVAAPVASGEAQEELMALRSENQTLKQKQATAAAELDALITQVSQKGVEGL